MKFGDFSEGNQCLSKAIHAMKTELSHPKSKKKGAVAGEQNMKGGKKNTICHPAEVAGVFWEQICPVSTRQEAAGACSAAPTTITNPTTAALWAQAEPE